MVLLITVVSLAAALVPSTAKEGAQREISGSQVFQQHCASCHAGGGNRVKATRPVAGSKELASLATFKSYLSAPPGHMPYYQHVVNDKEKLEALYKYCKTLKPGPMKQASKVQLPQTAFTY